MISLLHCTTEYPTHMASVNLRAMQTLQSAFKLNAGYSDHTEGIAVPIVVVALVLLLSRSTTIDRSLPGPDHQASLEPMELKQMINSIRNIEQLLVTALRDLLLLAPIGTLPVNQLLQVVL